MIRRTGLILTNAPSMAIVEDALARGGYDLLKVVDGWGLPGGWNAETIVQAIRATPMIIVRTTAGDPSVDGRWGGPHAFVDQHRVEASILGWYLQRPDIWVELGNEPNCYLGLTDGDMYTYRYYLAETIKRCRVAFPRTKLIAPAMQIGAANDERFMAICADVFAQCDAVAIHAYEWTRFAGSIAGRKGDLERAFALAGQYAAGRPLILSEYGINDPQLAPAAKGTAYAQLLHGRALPENLIAAAYYHLCVDGAVEPEYHLYPHGDLAYHAARYGLA